MIHKSNLQLCCQLDKKEMQQILLASVLFIHRWLGVESDRHFAKLNLFSFLVRKLTQMHSQKHLRFFMRNYFCWCLNFWFKNFFCEMIFFLNWKWNEFMNFLLLFLEFYFILMNEEKADAHILEKTVNCFSENGARFKFYSMNWAWLLGLLLI